MSSVSTPYPSALMRYAPVASPVDKLAEIVPRYQIMSPLQINGQLFYPGHKETFFLVIFGKIW